MGGVFSFIKKTSFYRFYNYDDSYLDSDEEDDHLYQENRDYSGYHELPYYGEINSENLYDSNYNTYTGYVKDVEPGIGVVYKIKS
jgi:hypothetical protein